MSLIQDLFQCSVKRSVERVTYRSRLFFINEQTASGFVASPKGATAAVMASDPIIVAAAVRAQTARSVTRIPFQHVFTLVVFNLPLMKAYPDARFRPLASANTAEPALNATSGIFDSRIILSDQATIVNRAPEADISALCAVVAISAPLEQSKSLARTILTTK